MALGQRERAVEAAIDAHIKMIDQCLAGFCQVLEAYLDGADKKAWELWETVDQLEHRADQERREVVRLLSEGAFLPVTREDIKLFVEAADKIADAAESATDTLILTKPDIPGSLRDGLLQLARESVASLGPLAEATAAVFTDFDVALAKTAEVDVCESTADQTEWHLIRDMFAEDIDLAQKLHLRQVIEELGKIADRAENAADLLQTLVVKKQF